MNSRCIKCFFASFFPQYGSALVLLLMVSIFGSALAAAQQNKTMMTGSAAKPAAPANLEVVPDLAQRLAKFQRVQMPFHSAALTPREQQLVRKLVEACGYLESIYWRQSDPEGLALYPSLASGQ